MPFRHQGLAAPLGSTEILILSLRTSRSVPPFSRSRMKRDAVTDARVWVVVALVRSLTAIS